MAVKVEVEERGDPRSEYPKLMKSTSNDLVILFTAPGKGAAVRGWGFYELGEFSDDWAMSTFEDFHGSITLSND